MSRPSGSPLAEATFLNSDAAAKACRHTLTCPTCPTFLGQFLDAELSVLCEEGAGIRRLLERSKQAIAAAVSSPMRREIPS